MTLLDLLERLTDIINDKRTLRIDIDALILESDGAINAIKEVYIKDGILFIETRQCKY